jgi:hypothetical protein
MVAEWGVYHRVGKLAGKSAGFRTLAANPIFNVTLS